MLPVPFEKYIPQVLRENITSSGQALINYMDSFIETEKEETVNLRHLLSPEQCPAAFLDVFGYYIGANILVTDSERIKRQKIYNAISYNRLRGTWAYDIKRIIDVYTGESASLFTYTGSDDDRIMMGGTGEDATVYWNTFAGDLSDPKLGMLMIGSGAEQQIAGVVYIDLGYDMSEILMDTSKEVIPGDGVIEALEPYMSSIGYNGIDTGLGMDISAGYDIVDPTVLAKFQAVSNLIKNSVPEYYRVFLGYKDTINVFHIVLEVT